MLGVDAINIVPGTGTCKTTFQCDVCIVDVFCISIVIIM